MSLEMTYRRMQVSDHVISEEHDLNEETYYKVDIEGLPTMYVTGKGEGAVKAGLRKIVKKPDMVTGVERVTKADVKKAFRMKAMDKDEE
jgi:hypothetical protein